MLSTQAPIKFPVPFANGAGPSFIRTVPIPSQTTVQAGAASMTDGFPPDNFTPIETGGTPPWGQDVNGLLNQITQGLRWVQAGMPALYDADFSTIVNGYPSGAIVASNLLPGKFFMSTVENNTTNPDALGAGWSRAPGFVDTGDFKFSLFSAVPTGWVPAAPSFTIGNAASGANYPAADAIFLYVALWTEFSNTDCPVTGGRGANALADFNAGKPMQVRELAGTGLIGKDYNTGRLTSVPVTSGAIQSSGAIIGENLHTLTVAELAPHPHVVSGNTGTESVQHTHDGSGTTGGMTANDPHGHANDAARNGGGSSTGGGGFPLNSPSPANVALTAIPHGHPYSFTTLAESIQHIHNLSITSQNAGGGASHNTVHRSMTCTPLLKL